MGRGTTDGMYALRHSGREEVRNARENVSWVCGLGKGL